MFLIYILKINQNKNQKSIYIRNETSKILICILIVIIS